MTNSNARSVARVCGVGYVGTPFATTYLPRTRFRSNTITITRCPGGVSMVINPRVLVRLTPPTVGARTEFATPNAVTLCPAPPHGTSGSASSRAPTTPRHPASAAAQREEKYFSLCSGQTFFKKFFDDANRVGLAPWLVEHRPRGISQI